MKWISVVLIAALLAQTGYAPCAAVEAVVTPKGDEIDRSKLGVGTYVEVTYYAENGRKRTTSGYIEAVDDDCVTVSRGRFWKKERIAYRDIITLTGPEQKAKNQKHRAVMPKVAPGARVRITAPDVVSQPFPGILVGMGADTLVVKTESGSQLSLPLISVTRVELNLKRKSKAAKGALIGFLAGATSGAILGAVIGEEGEYTWRQ